MRAFAALLTVAALVFARPALAEAPDALLQTSLLQGWVLGPATDEEGASVTLLVRSVVGARGAPGSSTTVRGDYPALARALGLTIRPLTADDLGTTEAVVTLTEIVDPDRPDVVDRYGRTETRGDLVPIAELYLEARLAGADRPREATLLVLALEAAALDPS